ncbi:MAG TPA: glycosyltransferase family 2 protein [Rhizomicrobium sp.]|nr:glycosyltransferase family 2 protein [Rhizomicrobium sp.]
MVSLSIVVPVKDEAGNAAALAREIATATAGESAEIIFVDDGSTDGTVEELQALKAELPNLRLLRHNGNFGQSRAVRTGVQAARGDLVATLDGDGQNDPADIPRLLSALRADNTGKLGLVGGVRVNRQDASNRRLASTFANGFRRWMLKDSALDSGCGLRVFRRRAYLALPYFDHMHRFLIALMLREGYEVREIPVNHRARTHGISKYNNLRRALVGVVDTLGVRWLQSRTRGTGEPEEI